MNTNQILEEWHKESLLANQCIVEVLESYMSFVELMNNTVEALVNQDDSSKRELIKVAAKLSINQAKENWIPLLNEAKELLEKDLQQE